MVSHNTTGDSCDVTYTFEYDVLGRKTTVKVGSQKLSTNSYKTDRSSLLSQAEYENGGKVVYGYYDAQGRPAMVKCNGTMYTYELNLQGDVVGIVDSAGTRVVVYKYDAWGRKVTSTGSLSAGLGKMNLFRYRNQIISCFTIYFSDFDELIMVEYLNEENDVLLFKDAFPLN